MDAARDVPAPYPGKTNLSHSNPLNPVGTSKRKLRFKRNAKKKMDGLHIVIPRGSVTGPKHLSLRAIAQYLIHCSCVLHPGSCFSWLKPVRPTLPQKMQDAQDFKVVKKTFTPRVRKYLESKGYSPQDVLVWAWILAARDGRMAGLRLDLGTRVDHSSKKESEFEKSLSSHRIPPFLLLFTLRHRFLPRSIIHRLLPLMEKYPAMISESKTIVLFLIRLLRRFRENWPFAIPIVARLITKYLVPVTNSPHPSAWLTATYNRLLFLLSLPPSDRPFKSLTWLQRSQFILLRKMAVIGIPITREGYRAIITIQLAHSKTGSEQDWVRNMNSSWPPWPKEKDGWEGMHRHAHKQIVTRAGNVIHQMMEAGYPLGSWEKEAMILAGRDTDQSPTIQTRGFWTRRIGTTSMERPLDLWAARIRATRTLEEAWAIFLACRKETPTRVPERDVWEEMFEKVIWGTRLSKGQQKRANDKWKRIHRNWYQETNHDPDSEKILGQLRFIAQEKKFAERKLRIVPGDGKELVPAPISPWEGVHVDVPPPDTGSFFMMMKREGVVPSVRLVCMLVKEADTIQIANTILRYSELWDEKDLQKILSLTTGAHPLKALSNEGRKNSFAAISYQEKRRKDVIDVKVVTAYLYLLRKVHKVDEAVQVLRVTNPEYPPAWNIVLSSLTKALNLEEESRSLKKKRLRMIWYVYEGMKALVDEDSETIRILAVAAERATLLGMENQISWGGVQPVERVVRIYRELLGIESSKENESGNGGGLTTHAGSAAVADGDPHETHNSNNDDGNNLVYKPLTETPLTAPPLSPEPHEEPFSLPPMIFPDPAALHAYIRMLGLTNRHRDILQLIQWMHHQNADLDPGTMRKRVLIAARTFLEGARPGFPETDPIELGVADVGVDVQATTTLDTEEDRLRVYVLEKCRALVEEWEEWPTDDEVSEYCILGGLVV